MNPGNTCKSTEPDVTIGYIENDEIKKHLEEIERIISEVEEIKVKNC